MNSRTAQAPERTSVPTTDGLRLSALLEGRADQPMDAPARLPTLVFVHGYPDNLHIWDAVIEPLKSRYRIVRYDVRGAGLSDAPPSWRGYRLRQLLADFRRVIDRFSPDAPVHLVGHDWGSIQSWEFVSDPALAGRIASFVSVSGPSLDYLSQALRRQAPSGRVLKQIAASWYVGAFHLPMLAPMVWKLGLGRAWPALLGRLEKLHGIASHASQQRDGSNGIGLYRANVVARLLQPRALHAIAPVLLVVATRDPFVTGFHLDAIERWVPELSRVEIDAGHWLPLSQPAWLATQIAAWVARH